MPATNPPPVPVIIAGCGAITKFFYASALAYLEEQGIARVVALCDPHEPNRAGIHARFPNAKSLAKLEDAPLTAGSVVVVASPPKIHAAQSILALEKGCAVLCEKPMAATPADAQAMADAAQRTGRPLAIGLYRRFFRATQLVKDLCQSKTLGRPVSFEVEEGGPFRWEAASDSFFRREATPGGVLYDTGVHTLDLLLWWFDEPIRLEYRDDAAGGLEANCKLQLEYASGLRGEVRLSRDWATRNIFRINFERGSASWFVGQAGQIAVSLEGVGTVLQGDILPVHDDGLGLTGKGAAEGSPQAFIRQLINVIKAARGEESLLIPATEGLRSLQLIEACYRQRRPLEQPWMNDVEKAGLSRIEKGSLT